MTSELNLPSLYRQLKSERVKREFGGLFSFLIKLIRVMPTRLPPITPEIWDMDHYTIFIRSPE